MIIYFPGDNPNVVGGSSRWDRAANNIYPKDVATVTVSIGTALNPNNRRLLVAGDAEVVLNDFYLINTDTNFTPFTGEQFAGSAYDKAASDVWNFSGTWSDAANIISGSGAKNLVSGEYLICYIIEAGGTFTGGVSYTNGAGTRGSQFLVDGTSLLAEHFSEDATYYAYVNTEPGTNTIVGYENKTTGHYSETIYTDTEQTQIFEDATQAIRVIINATGINYTANNVSLFKIVATGLGTGLLECVLPAFADDAAAGAGGITINRFYQTDGTGAAPLNVAGMVMVKQ